MLFGLPWKMIGGLGAVAAVILLLLIAQNTMKQQAISAANSEISRRVAEVQAEKTNAMMRLKAQFEAELEETRAANERAEDALKELQNDEKLLDLPNDCGVPAVSLRKIEAIR